MLNQSTLTHKAKQIKINMGEIPENENPNDVHFVQISTQELARLNKTKESHASVSNELLKLSLPALGYYYGNTYSGIIARELFSYAYDFQYGIPELTCDWYNVICKAQNFGAYHEYYNVYLPLREVAGDLGKQYGPGLFAAAAWMVAPTLARLSLKASINTAQYLGPKVAQIGRTFWDWCQSDSDNLVHNLDELHLDEKQPVPAPELEKEEQPVIAPKHEKIVFVFPKIEFDSNSESELLAESKKDSNEELAEHKVLQFSKANRTIEALMLDGTANANFPVSHDMLRKSM